jgi:hypothetical protein
MAECECLGGCPFFNDRMQDMEGMAALFKQRYCLGDMTRCARHVVFERLGKPAVPPDLYPNQFDRAQEILAAAQ